MGRAAIFIHAKQNLLKHIKTVLGYRIVFKHLNTNSLVFVNHLEHVGIGWGEVVDDKCVIEANKTAKSNTIIVGERCDTITLVNFNKLGIAYATNEDGAVTRLSYILIKSI